MPSVITRRTFSSSIVNLSAVQEENENLRIDPKYFEPRVLELSKRIKSGKHSALKDLTRTLRKGIFDVKADTYVKEGGVPFVRVGDLKSGLIDFDTVTQIPCETHQLEAKTALYKEDIVLSKTAYPAAALVSVATCNCSQDTIAAGLNETGRVRFRAGYILSYLNSSIGKALCAREFRGNIQEHLGLRDAGNLLIPEFSQTLHDLVHGAVESAIEAEENAKRQQKKAEQDLRSALGIERWHAKTPPSFVAKLETVRLAERLDAKHFSPDWTELRARIASQNQLLSVGEMASVNRRGVQPIYVEGGNLPVVASQNITPIGIQRSKLQSCDQTSLKGSQLKQALIKKGDVLIYTTGAYVGRTAVYEDHEPALASNHVNILRLKNYSPVLASIVMNSIIGQLQTDIHTRGTAQAELYASDIAKFEMPVFSAPKTEEIVAIYTDGQMHLDLSRKLFSSAIKAVEIAIARSENESLEYLSNIVK